MRYASRQEATKIFQFPSKLILFATSLATSVPFSVHASFRSLDIGWPAVRIIPCTVPPTLPSVGTPASYFGYPVLKRRPLWPGRFTSVPVHTGKGTVHHRTGLEGPEEGQRHSSTLSLSSAPEAGGWLTTWPFRLIPGKESGYPFYRRGVGPHPPVWAVK